MSVPGEDEAMAVARQWLKDAAIVPRRDDMQRGCNLTLEELDTHIAKSAAFNLGVCFFDEPNAGIAEGFAGFYKRFPKYGDKLIIEKTLNERVKMARPGTDKQDVAYMTYFIFRKAEENQPM